MWDRKESKLIGKERFKLNYWRCVLAALIVSVASISCPYINSSGSDIDADAPELAQDMSSVINDTVSMSIIASVIGVAALAGLAVKIFLFNPLKVGCFAFFRENLTEDLDSIDLIGWGFKDYIRSVGIMFLMGLYIALWSLLLIVPGIIKSYSYRMVPFIIRDNPDMTASEAITHSRKMMDGHKWDMFVFDLSYIGWYILGGLTCGLLNIFWTEPYRQSANAHIYRTLCGEHIGLTGPESLS